MSGSNEKKNSAIRARFRISLDTWAVAIALAAALLVRAGLLKHIPW
ncbi:MAG: hypothetical protein ACHP78_10185 [Terriglobales bacterium]